MRSQPLCVDHPEPETRPVVTHIPLIVLFWTLGNAVYVQNHRVMEREFIRNRFLISEKTESHKVGVSVVGDMGFGVQRPWIESSLAISSDLRGDSQPL